MFGVTKTQMVTKDAALEGRDTPLQVADRHMVLGTPLARDRGLRASRCSTSAWAASGARSASSGKSTACTRPPPGYIGGWTKNPTYQETCTSLTGHTEAVQVVYDPSKVSIETLLAAFWENHDPTTPNRQGGDVGTQYRSAIFATTPEQLKPPQCHATPIRSGWRTRALARSPRRSTW